MISAATASDDKLPRNIQSPVGEKSERFEKHTMPLVSLESTNRQEHAVRFVDLELGPHPIRVALLRRHSIWNCPENRLIKPQLRSKRLPSGLRHHNNMIGFANRPPERDSSPQRLCGSKTTMHRNDVRQAEPPSGGCAVDCHGEFVTVNRVNTLLTEHPLQFEHT